MKRADLVPQKVVTLATLLQRVQQWRLGGKKVCFTNGVFDILHAGHIYSLSSAAKEADYLIVAVNADESVRKLKGPTRPLNKETERSLILASLVMVDAVIIFREDTPLELIKAIMPDVLVKGGDYTVEEVAGSKEVLESGGRVVINEILEGFSTTSMIENMSRH